MHLSLGAAVLEQDPDRDLLQTLAPKSGVKLLQSELNRLAEEAVQILQEALVATKPLGKFVDDLAHSLDLLDLLLDPVSESLALLD